MLNIQPDIQSVSFFDTKSVDISITRRRVVFIEASSESLNDSLEFYLAVWTLVGILASIFLKIRRKRKTWKKTTTSNSINIDSINSRVSPLLFLLSIFLFPLCLCVSVCVYVCVCVCVCVGAYACAEYWCSSIRFLPYNLIDASWSLICLTPGYPHDRVCLDRHHREWRVNDKGKERNAVPRRFSFS